MEPRRKRITVAKMEEVVEDERVEETEEIEQDEKVRDEGGDCGMEMNGGERRTRSTVIQVKGA